MFGYRKTDSIDRPVVEKDRGYPKDQRMGKGFDAGGGEAGSVECGRAPSFSFFCGLERTLLVIIAVGSIKSILYPPNTLILRCAEYPFPPYATKHAFGFFPGVVPTITRIERHRYSGNKRLFFCCCPSDQHTDPYTQTRPQIVAAAAVVVVVAVVLYK